MDNPRSIYGLRKHLFNAKLKLVILAHFTPALVKGELAPRRFILLLRRLLYFFSRLQSNKFVRIGKQTRVDLYVPFFPSKAFFTACQKFATFGKKLPCATALISITSACRFRCEHCYQKMDRGKDVDIERLVQVVSELQDKGVAFFNIEGGEPFLVFDRLKKVCAAIDERSEVWVNSTGDGMTLERLEELKELNLTAVMFSMHSPVPEEFNAFLKSDRAWTVMTDGVRLCHEAQVPVAFNMCLKRESFSDGTFMRLMDKARELGAAIIQVIKPKPAGGLLHHGVQEFRRQDVISMETLVGDYNTSRRYKDFPSISAQMMEEDPSRFGCTAGGTDRFYINAKGDLQPCEFLNLSFGNIATDDFGAIYDAMRRCFQRPGVNWLCERCAGSIIQRVESHNLESLPLDPLLSREVYTTWDRGSATELYDTIENKLISRD
jgi:MoaA/NifB/PqqE/SkfB family radical SAM enzyme